MKKKILSILILLSFFIKAMDERENYIKKISSLVLKYKKLKNKPLNEQKKQLSFLRDIFINLIKTKKININDTLQDNVLGFAYTPLDLYKYLGFPDLKAIKFLVEKGANINQKCSIHDTFTKNHTQGCAILASISNTKKKNDTFKMLFKTLQYFLINGAHIEKTIWQDDSISAQYLIHGKIKTCLKNVLKFKETEDKIKLFFDCIKNKQKDTTKLYLCLIISDAIKKLQKTNKINLTDMLLYKLYKCAKNKIQQNFKTIGLQIKNIDLANTDFPIFLRYILKQITSKKIETRQFAFADKAYNNLNTYLDEIERIQFIQKYLNNINF